MGGQVLDYEEKRIMRRGERRGEKRGIKIGVKQGVTLGQDSLVNAIHELKNGKSPDDLAQDGVDETTIQRALSCL